MWLSPGFPTLCDPESIPRPHDAVTCHSFFGLTLLLAASLTGILLIAPIASAQQPNTDPSSLTDDVVPASETSLRALEAQVQDALEPFAQTWAGRQPKRRKPHELPMTIRLAVDPGGAVIDASVQPDEALDAGLVVQARNALLATHLDGVQAGQYTASVTWRTGRPASRWSRIWPVALSTAMVTLVVNLLS